MYSVNFQTDIKNGIIEVPSEYINIFKGTIHVIILPQEQPKNEWPTAVKNLAGAWKNFPTSEKLTHGQKDPIYQVRGMLKGKNGGSALFMRDKQAEIEKEYNL